ncbi:MAG: 2OG-Fe(II) oxygenase [Acidobacteriaceae bacterium]|nr:2OG-Fe(II) oxygenase [Acidobacteriaceae bacterium]
MIELVHPAVLSQTAARFRDFDTAVPFRHLVFDDFLDPEFCRSLAHSFPAFDPALATNEVGEVGRKAVHPDVKSLGPAYQRFDQLMQSREFLALLETVTGIPKLLYDPQYIGGGTHENLHGQDLDTHVDFNFHPATKWHRRLNLILFLNEEWQQNWGGLLELQKDPSLPAHENITATVLPLLNRCVIFETTESSWHGFRKILLPEDRRHLSRRSLAVYFYTKDRPAAELGPSHGTIYVPRPLPGFVQPGHALTEHEVFELEELFARRDAQIRYLYDREKEFSRIAESPSFRLARSLTWPLRQLRRLR